MNALQEYPLNLISYKDRGTPYTNTSLPREVIEFDSAQNKNRFLETNRCCDSINNIFVIVNHETLERYSIEIMCLKYSPEPINSFYANIEFGLTFPNFS